MSLHTVVKQLEISQELLNWFPHFFGRRTLASHRDPNATLLARHATRGVEGGCTWGSAWEVNAETRVMTSISPVIKPGRNDVEVANKDMREDPAQREKIGSTLKRSAPAIAARSPTASCAPWPLQLVAMRGRGKCKQRGRGTKRSALARWAGQ